MENASIKITVELSTPSTSVASVRETAEKEIFAMLLYIVHYTPERQAKELARLRKIYTAKNVNGFLADAIMWTGGHGVPQKVWDWAACLANERRTETSRYFADRYFRELIQIVKNAAPRCK